MALVLLVLCADFLNIFPSARCKLACLQILDGNFQAETRVVACEVLNLAEECLEWQRQVL